MTLRTGPNGESTIRSKVPARSSWRTVATGSVSSDVTTENTTRPTTTNA
jgi:hypothetical protein